MSHKGLHKLLLIFGFLFPWFSPLSAQNNRLMLLNEEWDSYSQTSNRHVNGWDFCKSGINDPSIVQRGNLHAFLSTGSSAGSGTTIATPWLDQIADTFSFYIYGSTLNGHTAQVEFGFIPDNATISDPSDICTCFIPYDTVNLSVSNQWQRTTRDMRPYYAIHGTTHRLAIRLINSYSQKIYLDEIRAWIPKGNTSTCPNITSVGRDFWVMFLYNHNYGTGFLTEEQRLYFLGDQTSSVTISNNNSGSTSATLSSPSFSATQLCGTNQQIVGTVYECGYHITSSEDIWVYADDFIDCNQDVATILPTEALGTHYIVQSYPSTNDYGAEVGFLATQDGTTLSFTVPCDVLGTSITAGTPLTITLNSGQTYMLMASAGGSFSGMEVSSNGKPFALFVAGQNTAVPLDGIGRDYTYEQALPVNLWGTEFIVSSTIQQNYNRLLITASADGCIIMKDGTPLAGPLAAGQTWEGVMPTSTQWHLTASSPIQVILYFGSYQTVGNIGDPSAVTIPPLNHGICDARFISIGTPEIPSSNHYINIICHQDLDVGLQLDDSPLPTSEIVATLGDYRCHQVRLTPGEHRLHNNLGPFIAYAYGLGLWESYAYPLGFAVDTIPVEPQPQPLQHDTITYSDSICMGQPYLLPEEFFCDGITYTPPSGLIYVRPSETAEAGTLEHWSNWVDGDTLVHHIHLILTILPSFSEEVYVTLPPDDSIAFADTVIGDTGTYVFHLTATNGCDSTVTLHVHACVVTLCVEFTGRTFIDFDYPVVTLRDCSPDRHTTRWEFSDGYRSNGERVRRQFQYPLPDTVIATMTTCDNDGCCGDTTFGFAPKIRSVWFPNIFFPDQESNNRFGCYTSHQVVDFQLEIYNRWGLLVWRTTDIATPWDGTHDGTPVTQGAYVYRWFLEDIYGDRKAGTGTVTLIR